MSFAALLGIGIGHALGGSALPLPITIATTGILALVLFAASKRVRAA